MAAVLTTEAHQLSLAFDDAPFWDGDSLEAAIGREAGRPLSLTLTDNRSVLLSVRRQQGVFKLRLHHMFLHAPLDVVRALARGLRRRTPRGDVGVRRFMNENLHRVRRVPRTMPKLETRGRIYDLGRVYDGLNRRFFERRLKVPITWGRGSGRARSGGITFGSYDPVLKLIRIHPILDRREVPRYFLESVVYHEMLHHQLGGYTDSAGRTIYHSRAFREAESRYPQHQRALQWEKRNLPRLLKISRAFDRQGKRPERHRRR